MGRADRRNSDVGPDVVVGQDLAENAREKKMRKREKDVRRERRERKARKRTSERVRRIEACGKEKGVHAPRNEIKKREPAEGKNSRFGICVSEAIQRRRRRRRCTNVTRALQCEKKNRRDMMERPIFFCDTRLKMRVIDD